MNTSLGPPRGIIGIEISCTVVRPYPVLSYPPILSVPSQHLCQLVILIIRIYKTDRRRRPYSKMLGRPHSRLKLTTGTYIKEMPQFLGRCDLYPNLAVGSYDGFVRIFDMRNLMRPVREADVGGGAWRVKFHPSNIAEWAREVLVGAMHAGCRVVRLMGMVTIMRMRMKGMGGG